MNSTDWTSQVRRGILEFCVLTLVSEAPRYGYDLVTSLSHWEQLAVKEGTLYPLLRRLQKDELLDSFWQESESGPPRKYYQITAKGQELLGQMTAEWAKLTTAVQELQMNKGVETDG